MSVRGKVVPLSPNCSSSSESSETIVLSSFKLKPAGTGATRNTLVENDSLSSFSWPEEISHKNGASQPSGEIAKNGVSRDSSQDKGAGNEQRSLTFSNPSRKGHVVIDIDDTQDAGPIQEPLYVEAYMKVMYWMCVSPFNPKKNRGKSRTSWTEWALNVIQKGCFTFFIAMSLLRSFFLVKFFVIFNLEHDSLENFVDMMFFIMMLVTKMYYVHIFVRHQKKLEKTLMNRYKLQSFRKLNQETQNGLYSTMTYATVLGITSALIPLCITTWEVGVTNWTPQQTTLYHSKSFAAGLVIWTKEHLNDTYLDALQEKYGQDLSTTNLLFGLLGLIIHFCSGIHMDTLANIMLTNSKTVKLEMGEISMKISNPENDIQNITLSEFLREDGNWAHFQLIKRVVTSDNDAFDSLMKFEHAYNMMLFVFFALNLFDSDFGWVYKGNLLYRIIKASYTYRIAAKAARLNDNAKDWIQRLSWKTTDKSFLERVPMLLYELEKKPLGVGRGQFLVDESFLYRFLGMVGSVFVLEADAKETNTD